MSKMWLVGLPRIYKGRFLRCGLLQSLSLYDFKSSNCVIDLGKSIERLQVYRDCSSLVVNRRDVDKGVKKVSLAENLACLVEEASSNLEHRRPHSRMELKRSLEFRIKKRVKEQYKDGKFQDLMLKVIATRETLRDAYDIIRLDSNVDMKVANDELSFESLAEEISSGSFDVHATTFSISTKGASKETLALPKLKLRVVQEAIRIVLEVIYKPHFSKISHGCRSGRGHHSALRYVRKEICNPDSWFTMIINKKLDAFMLAKLISIMEDKIEDPSFYGIIQQMFEAQVLNVEFGGFPKGHGLPQEGVLCPILINIYLDAFDREFYRLSLKYEVLTTGMHCDGQQPSKLRSWFRKKLTASDDKEKCTENSGPRIHACRFMDELFFAISGSEEVVSGLKSEIRDFLQNSLHLVVDDETKVLSCAGVNPVRFLGILVRRSVKESPALRAVHKLKEKIKLFAMQKQEAWDAGTVRIGKKWLAHGLKKVKESEIKHLADNNSLLNQVSCYRKAGMKTDHWYKVLVKIWMQEIGAKRAEREELILSKCVAEPALPRELVDSFYHFQKCAEEYVRFETAATLALLPSPSPCTHSITEVIAPVDGIKKRLFRYGMTTSRGHARTLSLLILQDTSQIIDWFSGIAFRWLRWYKDCDNFNDVQILIRDQVRKSCIRTLAAKYRIHENEIEKQFDEELSRIPFDCSQVTEQEIANATLGTGVFDNDEALTYGISHSGLCLLSLARMVSQSRPCNCFVIGCTAAAPSVYTLHVMERQKFPGWKTGFSSCIHPSLNRRRIGLCKQHLQDLYIGRISLQSVDFGSWK